jgi:DNA-directed RNA polymerase specialized sigma24 family protein
MPATYEGSVTHWIRDLKSGGDDAAQHLWERYFDRLVHLARQRLRGQTGAVEDEEDAALSAFDSFCRRAAQGRFPRLDDRDDLWRLLVVITVRKAFDQIDRRRREGWLVVGADLAGFAASEPGPEEAAMVVEEYQRLWLRLGNDSLRQVLDLSLQGYTREEIAGRIDRTVKTVARKLEVIRKIWREMHDRP